MPTTDLRALIRRLNELRSELLRDRPFYGRLLLRLTFGFANCGTAYTDMRHIVFDPGFASSLSSEELKFILLHELLHCVLKHCTRGRTMQPLLYNIACDIVVNSLILDAMGRTDFYVAGEAVMHLTPARAEGRLYNAEEVYQMLLETPREDLQNHYESSSLGSHEVWQSLKDDGLSDAWGQYVREAGLAVRSGSGIPYGLQRQLGDIIQPAKTNWRQLLQDFIRKDRCDFIYQVPDHRFQGDLIFPSFQSNLFGERVDRLWFLVDTSGSISDEILGDAFSEIRCAVEQIENLSGELSFFDTEVSEPIPFESVEELADIIPVGGGGTSFFAVFQYLRKHYVDELPQAIIILTDGQASFPKEEASLDVPVLWIILDSDIDAPWGTCINIRTESI